VLSHACLPQIEAAYDVLFMHGLQRRITGELQVPTGVRYADVPQQKKRGSGSGAGAQVRAGVRAIAFGGMNGTGRVQPPGRRESSSPKQGRGSARAAAHDAPARARTSHLLNTQRGGAAAPQLLQKLPGGVGVAAPAAPSALALQVAVFGALSAWAVAGALLESPEAQAADTAGVQLALAGAFSIYQLKEAKRLSIGARGPGAPGQPESGGGARTRAQGRLGAPAGAAPASLAGG
jgi:hypothetical protein